MSKVKQKSYKGYWYKVIKAHVLDFKVIQTLFIRYIDLAEIAKEQGFNFDEIINAIPQMIFESGHLKSPADHFELQVIKVA